MSNLKRDRLLAKYLAKHNDPKYNHTKAAEELNELATVLLQRVNKAKSVSSDKIIEELGDVEFRIGILKEIYSKKAIQKRIQYKESRARKNIKLKKYGNKV